MSATVIVLSDVKIDQQTKVLKYIKSNIGSIKNKGIKLHIFAIRNKVWQNIRESWTKKYNIKKLPVLVLWGDVHYDVVDKLTKVTAKSPVQKVERVVEEREDPFLDDGNDQEENDNDPLKGVADRQRQFNKIIEDRRQKNTSSLDRTAKSVKFEAKDQEDTSSAESPTKWDAEDKEMYDRLMDQTI